MTLDSERAFGTGVDSADGASTEMQPVEMRQTLAECAATLGRVLRNALHDNACEPVDIAGTRRSMMIKITHYWRLNV
ncbi:hypothetical protein A5N77_03960 [Prescottella equi]|nr:hypothetical protein A6F59_14720 [Prescottella equi]ORM14227.1 hypothetical protein A5N77_03960 [Prescottella equi]